MSGKIFRGRWLRVCAVFIAVTSLGIAILLSLDRFTWRSGGIWIIIVGMTLTESVPKRDDRTWFERALIGFGVLGVAFVYYAIGTHAIDVLFR